VLKETAYAGVPLGVSEPVKVDGLTSVRIGTKLAADPTVVTWTVPASSMNSPVQPPAPHVG
jgi:hypothetical protein